MWAGSARGDSPTGVQSESEHPGDGLDLNFDREIMVPPVVQQSLIPQPLP